MPADHVARLRQGAVWQREYQHTARAERRDEKQAVEARGRLRQQGDHDEPAEAGDRREAELAGERRQRLRPQLGSVVLYGHVRCFRNGKGRHAPALRPVCYRLNLAASSEPLVAFAFAVGMRAGARELAALHDQVLVADRPVLEEAFQDLARARRVARLRRERGARDVRRHAVMRHGPPWMILRRGLRGTRRRPHSRRAGRFPAPARWRRGRRSCRAPCSPDRRRASSSTAACR